MAPEGELSKEAFLAMAEASGLDVNDQAHMDELYVQVVGLLPSLRSFHQLDLSGVEPALVYLPPNDQAS